MEPTEVADMPDIICPQCHAVLEYGPEDRGTVCSCGACQTDIEIPAPSPPPVPGIVEIADDDEWTDAERLEYWKQLPEKSLEYHPEPIVRFLIGNKGNQRTIRYYGKYTKVRVVDVIEKGDMAYPYLKAEVDGETRHYNFEHITLPDKRGKRE